MEERLQPLGFTDDGTAVGYHAAPYLVQLSVKQQQQQQQKEENNCSRTSVNDVWNWTEREFTGNTAVGGGETHKKKQNKNKNNEIEKRKWGNDYKQDKWKSGEHMNTKQPQQQEWEGKERKKNLKF